MSKKLNYKLIDKENNIFNVPKTVLQNRGVIDWKSYLSLTDECEHSYRLLDNIEDAAKCILKHVSQESNIHIVVDSDVDGNTSAAMLYLTLKKIDSSLNITYSIHTEKQHGLSSDVIIPEDCGLLIIPDAGTNDSSRCKELYEKGINIVILDHHLPESDTENQDGCVSPEHAIIVNNQMCDYPNKNLCGAGVVYKLLQAIDMELWTNYADEVIDLVALANIADSMDMREPETRYLVSKGLKNINNKLFEALIKKQSYSIGEKLNVTAIQYFISPIINAMIRVGDQEEKELLFKAFTERDETFKYKKRGETESVDEDIYTRVARLCSNARSRQNSAVTKCIYQIDDMIEEKKLNNNKVLFVDVTYKAPSTLTGLIAIKLAEKYNKPCVMVSSNVKKVIDNDTKEEVEKVYYNGSIRNFDNSPVDSLRDLLLETQEFEFVRGHDNAAGVLIKKENIFNAIRKCNNILEKTDFEKCYKVDFDLHIDDLEISLIKDIDDISHLFGHRIGKPLVHVSGIKVNTDEIVIKGKEKNTWEIKHENGFTLIKQSCPKDDKILEIIGVSGAEDETFNWDSLEDESKEEYYIDIIGEANVNSFRGILTPQIKVLDYYLYKGSEL